MDVGNPIVHANDPLVADVISNGSKAVNADNSQQLAIALLKESLVVVTAALNAIKEDRQATKSVIDHMHKSAFLVIKSADEINNKVIDNAIANSNTLRTMIDAGDLSPETIKEYLEELHYYQQTVNEHSIRTLEVQERVQMREYHTADKNVPLNNTGRNVALVFGGGIIGGVAIKVILDAIKKKS